MANDNSTLPDPTAAGEYRVPEVPQTIALVIAWCADEPDRIGQVLLPSGSWAVFGRGGGSSSDPHPRLQPTMIRPGRVETATPLINPRLSRVQIRLRSERNQSIAFERLGQATLQQDSDSDPVDRGSLRPGDTLQLGRQLLLLAVRRSAWLPALQHWNASEEFLFGAPDRFGLVGESPAMWAVREQLAFVGRRHEHVLLLGASGVGKEMVARALHALGSSRPMVARNAATLPDGLIDAELFGNARNYPNPGMRERPGLIGEADGSTLFLDEFGELPRESQAHLLRVLDAGEYQRLGDSQVRRSRFRLIAATNRPPSVFKEDVFARLPLRVHVPDVDERREDIPLLARHALKAITKGAPAPPRLSLALANALVNHPFTTHFRELQALLLESLAHRTGPELDWISSALRKVPAARGSSAGAADVVQVPPSAFAPAHVQAALDAHHGNIELARRQLGLPSRHVLARLVSRHGLRAGRAWRPPSNGPL